jgi:hypothetical protein
VPRKPVVRRAPKRSAAAADTSAVFGEYGLTESYKRSVEAAFGSAQACITELFWLELETVVGVFLSLQQKHVNSPPRQQREFWRRFAERTSDLANNLRIIRRQTRWGHSDPMWANRGLMALWEIQDRSGRLEQIEKPHLGELIAKLVGPGERKPFVVSPGQTLKQQAAE